MTFVGYDLHTRMQQVALVDTETGEVSEHRLGHDGIAVEAFYAALPRPATVGIESTVKKRIGRGVMAKQLMQIFERSRVAFQQS
jgi:hypothetical protein